VASVRHLPESDLWGSSKEHVLGAIGDKLHKSSSHFGLYSISIEKNLEKIHKKIPKHSNPFNYQKKTR
jgi:hypothetical protein